MCDFSCYGGISDEWLALERTLPPPANPELALNEVKRLANEEREALSAKSMRHLAHQVHTRDYAIPSRDGSLIEVRSYRPVNVLRTTPLPLYIHLQGGGFMFGTLNSEDAICTRIACGSEVVVLNVNYRHTPEFTYPTPWNDAEDAFEWAHDNMEKLCCNPNKVENPDIKDTKLNPGNATPAQVKEMPPTVLGIVGLDPLRDEALLYAKMLTEAGVPTDVNLFIGLPHGFRSYEEKLSASARWDRVIEEGICWALSGPSPSNKFHVKT
ncbi:hypothetical protein ACJZ2D_007665 [Fusarium nematophilum]